MLFEHVHVQDIKTYSLRTLVLFEHVHVQDIKTYSLRTLVLFEGNGGVKKEGKNWRY